MDVKKGMDIQGIPWDMMATTRDKYRQSRLQRYANFENVPNSGRISEKAWHFQTNYLVELSISLGQVKFYVAILVQECMPAEKGQLYYEFQHNTRSVKSTILHFQVSHGFERFSFQMLVLEDC